ncbi:MAG TPA: hypothetical protein VKV16_02105 [Solirubrobacteraceae bacterium]|nr:hypothetical protein [Solirubrobacteraceae bacterium]
MHTPRYLDSVKPASAATRSHTLAPRLLRALALTLALSGVSAVACAASASAASAPKASTGASSNVTYSSAIIYGMVNPNGQATNFVFQYGTTRSYGSQTPLAPAGSGTSALRVSQTLTGLQPATTYHYRILASSPGGAATGTDHTFKTPPVPLSLAIAGSPNPVVFGSAFLVEGTLSGTGSASHAIALQANPFPYTAGFQTVGNPELTNANGSFSFPYLGLLQNTELRVVTVGKPEVSSPILIENVAVRVTLHVKSTKRHGYARLYGNVTPAEVGALVGFQLLRPGRSLNVGGTNVKAAGATYSSFSRVVHVKPGLYQALVRVNDGAHVSAYSRPVLIR